MAQKTGYKEFSCCKSEHDINQSVSQQKDITCEYGNGCEDPVYSKIVIERTENVLAKGSLAEDLPPSDEPQRIRLTRRFVYSPTPAPSTTSLGSFSLLSDLSSEIISDIESLPETDEEIDFSLDPETTCYSPRNFPYARGGKLIPPSTPPPTATTGKPCVCSTAVRSRSASPRAATPCDEKVPTRAAYAYQPNPAPTPTVPLVGRIRSRPPPPRQLPIAHRETSPKANVTGEEDECRRRCGVPGLSLFPAAGAPHQCCQVDVKGAKSACCQDGGGGTGGRAAPRIRSAPVSLPPQLPSSADSSSSLLPSRGHTKKNKLWGGGVPDSQPARPPSSRLSPSPPIHSGGPEQSCSSHRIRIRVDHLPCCADPDDVSIGGLRSVPPPPHTPPPAPDWPQNAPYVTGGRLQSNRSTPGPIMSPTAREMGYVRPPSGTPRERRKELLTTPRNPHSAYQENIQPNIYWGTPMDLRVRAEPAMVMFAEPSGVYRGPSTNPAYTPPTTHPITSPPPPPLRGPSPRFVFNDDSRNEPSPQYNLQLSPECTQESQDCTYFVNSRQAKAACISTLRKPQELMRQLTMQQSQREMRQQMQKEMQKHEELVAQRGIYEWPSATYGQIIRSPSSVTLLRAAYEPWECAGQLMETVPFSSCWPQGQAPGPPPNLYYPQPLSSRGRLTRSRAPPVTTTSSQMPISASVTSSQRIRTVTSSSQTPPCSVIYHCNDLNSDSRSASRQRFMDEVHFVPWDSETDGDEYFTDLADRPHREVMDMTAASPTCCRTMPSSASAHSTSTIATNAPSVNSTTKVEIAFKQAKDDADLRAQSTHVHTTSLENAKVPTLASAPHGDEEKYADDKFQSCLCKGKDEKVSPCQAQPPDQESPTPTDEDAKKTGDESEKQPMNLREKGEGDECKVCCDNKDNDCGKCTDGTQSSKEGTEKQKVISPLTPEPSSQVESPVHPKKDLHLCRTCRKNYKGNQGPELEF